MIIQEKHKERKVSKHILLSIHASVFLRSPTLILKPHLALAEGALGAMFNPGGATEA